MQRGVLALAAVAAFWTVPAFAQTATVPQDVFLTTQGEGQYLAKDLLLGAKYGHRLHFWDLQKRKHIQEIDFGEEHQLVFELRPAHDPTKAHGFVNCVISLEDLSSSIWTWRREGDKWAAYKTISIPAEPADPELAIESRQALQKKDRERKAAGRRDAGIEPRLRRGKPWKELGICRSTWYDKYYEKYK